MTYRGLDTCSWDEVDEQIEKLYQRLSNAVLFWEQQPQPLTKDDANWRDVLIRARQQVGNLREYTYDLYAYGEK